MAREKILKFRISEDEHRALRSYADKAGFSTISAFIRYATWTHAGQPVPAPRLPTVQHQPDRHAD